MCLRIAVELAITHLPFSFDWPEKLQKKMREEKQDANGSLAAAAVAKDVAVSFSEVFA